MNRVRVSLPWLPAGQPYKKMKGTAGLLEDGAHLVSIVSVQITFEESFLGRQEEACYGMVPPHTIPSYDGIFR